MKLNLPISAFLLLLVVKISLLISCKEPTITSPLIVHEIFNVTGDDSNKQPTTLRYKDVKLYDENGLMTQQNFYEIDNTLKGFEFITKQGQEGITNYYSADSILLAIYKIKYDNKNIVERIGYDGQTKDFLRKESFTYSKDGNLSLIHI